MFRPLNNWDDVLEFTTRSVEQVSELEPKEMERFTFALENSFVHLMTCVEKNEPIRNYLMAVMSNVISDINPTLFETLTENTEEFLEATYALQKLVNVFFTFGLLYKEEYDKLTDVSPFENFLSSVMDEEE